MGERLIVSGGGEIREYGLPQRALLRSIALEDCGALCAAGSAIYAACGRHDMIWRMDSELLVPTGLFAGGPGMCSLMLSPDGARLYALCSEADSLLMLSADSGAPLIVNRVGVNPCAMAMDESGRVIAVAGGASGEVLILCAQTLTVLARLQTPGVVFSAVMRHEMVFALSLHETMNTVLSVFGRDGQNAAHHLEGMPGALAVIDGSVMAATHRALWRIAPDGAQVQKVMRLPGRAAKLFCMRDGLLMTDVWSDTLYAEWASSRGKWHALAGCVRDAILL